MKRYYNSWKMKHPEPNDFLRVMEKESGLQLHWYYRYWIQTTKRIDYGIGNIVAKEGTTIVDLVRMSEFPMPIDLIVTYTDGTKELYYIPTNEMMGKKASDDKLVKRIELVAWPWVNPGYALSINRKLTEIESLEIDPSLRLADINRKNNKVVVAEIKPYKETTH